jgi:hypothetical protein
MAKVFIQESTLTAIGDAIRTQTSTTAKIAPGDMPAKILSIEGSGSGGYTPTAAELSYDGDMTMAFAYNRFNWMLEHYGDAMKLNYCVPLDKMFYESNMIREIPFVINSASHIPSYTRQSMSQMFMNCSQLKQLPAIKTWKPVRIDKLCYGCKSIVEVPDSFLNSIDWSAYESQTSQSAAASNGMFAFCVSLRKYPIEMIHFPSVAASAGYHAYYNMCIECYSLDEIVNIPVDPNTHKTNLFANSFNYISRAKDFTFAPIEGSVNWSNQTIDLSIGVGYMNNSSFNNATGYVWPNPIYDKVITGETYQELKDDPDACTLIQEYSRYDHRSAVNTINSLPATTGTGCVIKFSGNNGLYTVNGAISSLTDAEIAVAAAKGWTVSIV